MNINKLYNAISVLLVCITVCFLLPATETYASDDKRVLFISSYSYAWDTVQIQIEGIKQGLGEDIVIDYEFMDTKRFPSDDDIFKFYLGLKDRMSRLEPYDVIIVGDDAALNFAVKYKDDIFNNIPIVFEGINNTEYAIELANDPLITGILEELSFSKNIELARTLLPHATKVVGILDDSVTGEAERKQFYEAAAMYPEFVFSEINTSKLTTAQLTEAIRSLSKDTILIYIVMTEDASGVKYTNSQSIKLITSNSAVPAFRMVSGGIGEGLLGGNVVSMELSGKIAAEMATEIINGRDPATFDVVIDSPNIYMIDEAVMHRYNLNTSLIPEGTTVINHQPDFFERNKDMLVPTIISAIVLITIIILMIIRIIKQHSVASELMVITDNLKHTSNYDFLTQLGNRNKLYSDLSSRIVNNQNLSVFMFDIDHFKHINDTYGHNVGDEVLKELGERLIRISDDRFTPYRLAGDEFISILLSDQPQDIQHYADILCSLLNTNFSTSEAQLKVSISLGISTYPTDSGDMMELINCADKAMYYVKHHGKNNIALYGDVKELL